MNRFISFIILCFLSVDGVSQSQNYAREVVQTLASDEFKGRGYVENGDKLAANFIREQFQKFGLRSYSKDYFQPFNISVNTFPTNVDISVNGESLSAGKDFLIDPTSPSLSGTYKVIYINPKQLLSDNEIAKLVPTIANKFVVFGLDSTEYTATEKERINAFKQAFKYDPRLNNAGYIELSSSKLTWRGSTSVNARPVFTIHSDALSSRISEINLDVKNKFYEKYPTQNVIGYIEGARTDSVIVIMSHYDHLGKMGSSATFNGANDNASGTAMMLSLAQYYSENKPDFSIVFIAFVAEEMGLLGAQHFVENSPFNLSKIKFFLNFDLAGTGDEGIQVVNGSVYQHDFDRLKKLNENSNLLPAIKVRGAACNSDHCMFDRKNVPGFYIYTLGGIKAYHDIYDRAETLPLTEFDDYKSLMIKFINQL